MSKPSDSPFDSLGKFAAEKLDQLDRQHLLRRLNETDRDGPVTASRDGRRLISFCCNDYLNLSHHPEVIEAAKNATDRYGVGAGASRLITGNHPLFRQLEQKLAALKGSDDAIVFGSGYLTNLGVIPTLCGPNDLILADELSHSCLMMGMKLSGAAGHVFRHNDLGHLKELLDTHRGNHQHCLILTDGVFSMDGDLAPVPALAALSESYDAWLMTDDAHGIGVVGNGRGSTFAFTPPPHVPLQMGTLSKAIGGYGGYLCASQPVIDLMRTRARSFVYSTGLAPAMVAAAIKALEVIEADPGLPARPIGKARRFTRALNLPDPESAIVPVILGDAVKTLEASEKLLAEGYLVSAIRPPTVPAGTARLRFTFTAQHDDADIDRLAALVRDQILES